MSDELTDKDPFDDDQGEDLISEAMVKKATYLIHKLANRRGADYKEIQKKCKKLLGYENLAKVSMEEGHKIINKLIELTGGEEEKPQLPTNPDDGFKNIGKKVSDVRTEHKEVINETTKKQEAEHDPVTATMRASVRAAVDITLKEVVAKDVPVQGLGGFVFEISKVIFEAKMNEEAV
jgi:hypothetical protein